MLVLIFLFPSICKDAALLHWWGIYNKPDIKKLVNIKHFVAAIFSGR